MQNTYMLDKFTFMHPYYSVIKYINQVIFRLLYCLACNSILIVLL